MRQKEKILQMEREITRLFGESSYRVERRACTGKYRGHNDYSLVFGSGRRLYIGLDRRNYAGKLREASEAGTGAAGARLNAACRLCCKTFAAACA